MGKGLILKILKRKTTSLGLSIEHLGVTQYKMQYYQLKGAALIYFVSLSRCTFWSRFGIKLLPLNVLLQYEIFLFLRILPLSLPSRQAFFGPYSLR